jgi:hypothetical protein
MFMVTEVTLSVTTAELMLFIVAEMVVLTIAIILVVRVILNE